MTEIAAITIESTEGVVELFADADAPTALFFHPGVGLGLVFPALQGCTAELCGLRDRFDDLRDAGVRAYGVSTLDLPPMQEFVAEHRIRFPLISDPEARLGTMLGVAADQAAGDQRVYERITILVVPSSGGPQVLRITPDERQVDAICELVGSTPGSAPRDQVPPV